MEKTLSIVLDEYGKKSKTLMMGQNFDIDKFTTKFESSEDLREYFKDEINRYLESEKAYINACKRKNNGRIVTLEIIETSYNSYYFNLKRVLYKKHLAILNELIKNRKVIQRYIWLSKTRANELGIKSLVAPALIRETKCSAFKSQADFNRIKDFLGFKNSKENFYEKVRLLIKAYEDVRKSDKTLPTIDTLYKEITNKYEEKKQKSLQNPDSIFIDGKKYLVSDLIKNGFRRMADLDKEIFDEEQLKK